MVDEGNQTTARLRQPVISRAITPNQPIDEQDLEFALARLVGDDPTLRIRADPATRQVVLSGTDEAHLEASVARLVRASGVPFTAGTPTAAYRQTIAKPAQIETRYIRQTGGRGKYALITMRFEPLTQERCAEWARRRTEEGQEPDPDNRYFLDACGGVLPDICLANAEVGFRLACSRGVRHGFPCVDLLATVVGGNYHLVDGDYWTAFRLAAFECTRDAQLEAGVTLLEPIMRVTAEAAEPHLDELAWDLERRRGVVLDFGLDRGRCWIAALVPMASLLGYQGPASLHVELSHFAPVPDELADLSGATPGNACQ